MRLGSSKGQQCSFFIARVGSCAGMPLRSPYTSHNSFGVITNTPDVDFAKVMCLYRAGCFRYYMHGTCQPFIRREAVKEVFKLADNLDPMMLEKMAKALAFEEQLQDQVRKVNLLVDELALGMVQESRRKAKHGFVEPLGDTLDPKRHL